ncbi:MAG: pirin family protein [Polyangiales bacterium]
MITLRRAKERQHQRRRKQEAWLTFDAQEGADTLADGFGALGILKEGRLPPRTGTQEPREDAEIVTYVREGTLSFEDSTGQSGFIRAGEFQRMTAGRAVRYSETNASPTEWAHVFQIWLRPSVAGLEPGHEQKRFSLADRHGILCVVASPDARDNSLRIHQDAFLYSAILDRGGHIAHRLSEGRGAWLHVVHGEVTLGEVVLGTGDGVGVTAERVVSMTAREETEILLIDLDFEVTEPLAIEGSTEIATSLASGTSSPVPEQRNDRMKKFQLFLFGAAFGAALLLAPSQASAANCNFSRKEKIATVSWIMLIPGAVITDLACKHDLFTKKGKSEAMLPTEVGPSPRRVSSIDHEGT